MHKTNITYIKTDEGNCYLNMVTDAFSRKIMGYSIAQNMNTDEMKKAYNMAVALRTYPNEPLIHIQTEVCNIVAAIM